MKCQKCDKPATFHITDLTGDQVVALHLCPDCAREYLQPGESPQTLAPTLTGVLAQQLKLGQTAADLAELDQKECPVCGISFYEFRQAGRFGCPHDYQVFSAEIEPLLTNIHGQTRHAGKVPRRGVHDAQQQTELIRLRREMKDAVESEAYERASQLRDNIRKIEQEGRP